MTTKKDEEKGKDEDKGKKPEEGKAPEGGEAKGPTKVLEKPKPRFDNTVITKRWRDGKVVWEVVKPEGGVEPFDDPITCETDAYKYALKIHAEEKRPGGCIIRDLVAADMAAASKGEPPEKAEEHKEEGAKE